jgi:hypothetical protein
VCIQTIANRDHARKRRRITYSDSAVVYIGPRDLVVPLLHGKGAFRAIAFGREAAAIMRVVR